MGCTEHSCSGRAHPLVSRGLSLIHQTRGLTEVPACCFFTVSYRHRFMQLAHILWLHGFEACVTVSRVQMLQSSVLMVFARP